MNEIRVECYAGHRADERPLRFVLRGRQFEVSELDGRWYSPGASYFRVRADDGNYYVLRHDETQDSWTLDGFAPCVSGRIRKEISMEMVLKDLRRHQRLLISEGRKITAESVHPLLSGTVSVIGHGGMFIRTKNTHSCGTVLRLKLVDPFVVFEAECTVRNVAENGLGVEITGITFEDEKRLKTLLLHLKPQAS